MAGPPISPHPPGSGGKEQEGLPALGVLSSEEGAGSAVGTLPQAPLLTRLWGLGVSLWSAFSKPCRPLSAAPAAWTYTQGPNPH